MSIAIAKEGIITWYITILYYRVGKRKVKLFTS